MRRSSAFTLNHPRLRAGPWDRLPRGTHLPIARYVVEGACLSPVLRAVAAGDLYAVAQQRSGLDIITIAEFFIDMPERCRGSYERVAEWEMVGGLRGVEHLNEAVGRIFL